MSIPTQFLREIITCKFHYFDVFLILVQLEAAQTVEEMRALLDSEEFEFRFDIGVSDISSRVGLSDRVRIFGNVFHSCEGEGTDRSDHRWSEHSRNL